MFENMSQLKENKFEGFISISDLNRSDFKNIPTKRGVYIVYQENSSNPKFVKKSIGGHFKRKDPSVSVEELRRKWVNSAYILYIGKAGSSTNKRTIRHRLKEYVNFGKGKPVGHWGGRYIWQLEDVHSLKICWKSFDGEPLNEEQSLLRAFRNKYKCLPFANLRM